MVRADGLNGLSLRALGRAVDMEPQSLYTYFASKHAVYDHLFADGNRQLLTRFERIEVSDDPSQVLSALARFFVSFAAEDRARYELLFMRTIPDFEPSPESYAIAVEVFARGRSALAAVGIGDDADFDLWTALVAGLASRQPIHSPHRRRRRHVHRARLRQASREDLSQATEAVGRHFHSAAERQNCSRPAGGRESNLEAWWHGAARGIRFQSLLTRQQPPRLLVMCRRCDRDGGSMGPRRGSPKAGCARVLRADRRRRSRREVRGLPGEGVPRRSCHIPPLTPTRRCTGARPLGARWRCA